MNKTMQIHETKHKYASMYIRIYIYIHIYIYSFAALIPQLGSLGLICIYEHVDESASTWRLAMTSQVLAIFYSRCSCTWSRLYRETPSVVSFRLFNCSLVGV